MSQPLGREGGLGGDNIRMLGKKIGSRKNRRNIGFMQNFTQDTDLQIYFLGLTARPSAASPPHIQQ